MKTIIIYITLALFTFSSNYAFCQQGNVQTKEEILELKKEEIIKEEKEKLQQSFIEQGIGSPFFIFL